MARVYLSIGSNIDRTRNIRSCLQALHDRYGELSVSTIYESVAVGFTGDPFFNLAVGLDTEQDVHALVDTLHAIEHDHGRRRNDERFAPRTLDIDLLLYDDLVLNEPGLHLPRDEIVRYAFVLKPLAEIAGDRRHPTLGKTLAELWQAFDAGDQELWPVRLDV